MRVYFVRHGESVANVEETFSSTDPTIHPLTMHGEAQVAKLADSLKSVSFDMAYCSDLLRAVQTTEILVREQGIEYGIDRRLREHNMGVFDGQRDEIAWNALRELVKAWNEDGRSDIGPEGGESLDALQERFFSFIADLTQEFGAGNGTVLLVGHMGLFWSTLPKLFKNIDIEFVREREFGNAGMVIGTFKGGSWRCEEWVGERLP